LEVNVTTECEDWYLTLSQSDQEELRAQWSCSNNPDPGSAVPQSTPSKVPDITT